MLPRVGVQVDLQSERPALVSSSPGSCRAVEPRASAGASPHLLAGLDGDVLSKDLLGLGDHLGLGFDLLELLTGQPELQVLLTELGAQEGPEGSEPICGDRDTCLLPAHRRGMAL